MNPHKKVFYICLSIVVLMFGFSFALSPLYSAICKVTGINGKINLIPDNAGENTPQLNRQITVQFVATNNANLPWDFYPEKSSVEVHPGENSTMHFFAKNNTNHTMTVQAIPSISPGPAVLSFHKIECFCFRKQTLAAGEQKNMDVTFRIDKKLPREINTISLSYTLFEVKRN